MVDAIGESLRFMEALSGSAGRASSSRVDFFTSHEGAAAATTSRRRPGRCRAATGWYNLSTHFPWIGMRTAQLDGAHVEYFRGIRNPLGVKVGPAMTPERLLRAARRARSRATSPAA